MAGAAEILIVNRSTERGEELATLLTEKVHIASRHLPWHGDFPLPAGIDVLVNATSIGMGDPQARVPVALDSLPQGLIVADVVIMPPQTRLLREARQQGCQALDGLGMLINQAVIGFQIWTGQTPDAALMREAAEEFLGT